jgi:uncharacterized protein (TIGR01244 family)
MMVPPVAVAAAESRWREPLVSIDTEEIMESKSRPVSVVLTGLLLVLALGVGAADEPTFGLPAEGRPEPGILTAAQPSPEQIRMLAEAGYRAVVNLRTDAEMTFDQRALVESLGMEYHTIPVGGPDDVSEAGARQLHEILEAVDGPVLVHCASANRAGALIAVRAALLEEMSAEAALEKGRAGGLKSLEPRVREVIGAEPDQAPARPAQP